MAEGGAYVRGDRKYYIILGLALMVYVTIQFVTPKTINWTITLAHEDKNPFGSYVLDQIIADIFPDKDYFRTYETLYEQQDTLQSNQFILTTTYTPDLDDLNVMLAHVNEGGNVLISAHFFSQQLQDTLGFDIETYFSGGDIAEKLNDEDSAGIGFVHPELDEGLRYKFQRNTVYQMFPDIDTATMFVSATNDFGQAITIRVPFGKGNIILNTTPLAFTNIYLLHSNNREFVSKTLSMLPVDNIHWAEYYMQGRREGASPLRFILGQEGLRWAYYILLASLVIYMVIESKRTQRIIPVLKPLRNSSVAFVNTISSLYLEKKNHRSIADKRINYFLEQLYTRYFIPQHLEGRDLYEKVAAKTGRPYDQVEKLMKAILSVRTKRQITIEELKEINTYIEEFNL